MRVLLVEDDVRVAAAVASGLRKRGYEVDCAGSIAEALEAAPVDIVLLDLGLPDGDGMDLCRMLRARQPEVGIIAVTARGEERDRVTGLLTGADDYVVKPFSMAELHARMAAVLRRASRSAPATQQVDIGGLTIDFTARRVLKGGTEVTLTRKEFDILAALARRPGMAVGRDRIIIEVWQTSYVGPHVLDVHMAALRGKLGDPGLVQTVRGVGYRLSTEPA
ncbi:response regulator transcription factor [Virgisporangium aurantiacum]|jgi:DNA-binding response OmpR family regulator|uniref:Sensory transduction protein RegX3 n=1 Tax=Virgisporangium aurantiacum TaxID=175570 RepID=A0A8J3ZFF1_9ACTN|nr:response regulator transcription factor [Virgisporangium aurantiacum]GIJ60591.1 DNA-binding response regulator [Virgisporangium aurantiacum]